MKWTTENKKPILRASNCGMNKKTISQSLELQQEPRFRERQRQRGREMYQEKCDRCKQSFLKQGPMTSKLLLIHLQNQGVVSINYASWQYQKTAVPLLQSKNVEQHNNIGTYTSAS